MEHRGEQIIIPRMTEIIATMECEARGYLHPVNREETNWKTVDNAVALAGTFGHHRIENYIRKKMGLEEIELELDEPSKILKDAIYKSNQGYLWFSEYIKKAFSNFLEWENDFKPTYIVPEITMTYIHEDKGVVDPKKSVKGTVDLICELDPDKMSSRARDIVEIHEPSTVMLDWKTGMAKLESHHAQLEGYDWLLDATNTRSDLSMILSKPWLKVVEDNEEIPIALCVRLGGYTYFADAYKLNSGKFKKVHRLFKRATYLVKTRSEKYGDRVFREGYHCVFCPHREDKCPIFVIQKVDLEVPK